jgi:hypothetical protein
MAPKSIPVIEIWSSEMLQGIVMNAPPLPAADPERRDRRRGPRDGRRAAEADHVVQRGLGLGRLRSEEDGRGKPHQGEP